MKQFLLVGLVLLTSLSLSNAFADEAQEKTYLTQILNQLDAIQPLILLAEKEQPKNTRIQFHYTQYRDGQGHLHNGLLEDVQAIQQGVAQKLSQVSIEPRMVNPIKGDYLPSHTGNN